MSGAPTSFDIVIPTLGRPSLARLLDALAADTDGAPRRIVIVDDRPRTAPWEVGIPAGIAAITRVIRSGGRGPAAARNLGWRACASDWIVFLDDDVIPAAGWAAKLGEDLDAPTEVVGVQARIEVPLPSDRPPTDWERNVRGLQHARWITADMAYRRWALELLGGFDERFAHAYREDVDLALRALDLGLRLTLGARVSLHPPGPERFLGSLARQRGNQDDVLMRALHGPGWRRRAGAGSGRFTSHAVTTAVAVLGLRGVGGRRGVQAWWAAWLGLTAGFAFSRLRGGPGTARETIDMVVTSALIPPLAVGQRVAGLARMPMRLRRHPRRLPATEALPPVVDTVLFDRDGTLVADVPYNNDPARVAPLPGVADALATLRRHGVRIGVVTNQSGVGRGLITTAELAAVNARVEELLGPFETWQSCAHEPAAGCECRKPAPGSIIAAARELGTAPDRLVFVGDIGSDVEAARRAGARHVLVPTDRTLPDEVAAATHVAADLTAVCHQLQPHLRAVP